MKRVVLRYLEASGVAAEALKLGIFNYHVPGGPQVYTFDDMPGLFLSAGKASEDHHWITTTPEAELWLMLHLPTGCVLEEVDPAIYPELEKYLYD